MRTKSILPMLALVPMIGLAAGGALAQPRGPAAGDGPRRPMMARSCDDIAARQAAKIAFLQEKLALKPEQQQAWNTFAAQAKASAEPMRRLCAEMPKPPAPPAAGQEAQAPQRPAPDAAARLEMREKMLTAQLESTKTLRTAVDGLTPSLSAEQKVTLGKVLSGPRHFAHRGFRDHHHMRGHGERSQGERSQGEHGPKGDQRG